MSNPMNRLQKKKKQPEQQQPQQQQQQQQQQRYKYDMAHAEALRVGTLKTGERPPPTLREMHFPSSSDMRTTASSTATTSTAAASEKKAKMTKLEEEANLALQGLEKAESLHKERNDLMGAKRLYELSIGVLIRYLNESNNTASTNNRHRHHLSKEVIAERVRVALTDAEEIKQTLKLMEEQQEDNHQRQKRQSSWSSLSQSLSHALTGSKAQEQKEPSSSKTGKEFQKATKTSPPRASSSTNVSSNNGNNNQPTSGRSRPQRKQSSRSYGTSSYQKQTQASRQKQTQKQQPQSAKQSAARKTTTQTRPTAKPKPKPSANLPPQLIETIKQDFYVPSTNLSTTWNDISGLQTAKRSIQEAAILPLLRPDLYTGLRSPPRGILLYGPPGTGKTMLVKAAAKESSCLLFAASASVLTSKWHGEGEKLVRALFAFARDVSPAMIFLDEIDAILSSRSENEHEASRRMKTEFMIQMDGITKQQSSSSNGSEEDVQHQVLVLGCTNCPWDIDDAIMRRFTRRIYVPLPDEEARRTMLTHMLSKVDHSLTKRQIEILVRATDGYSCSDIASIGNEASFGPLRSIGDLDVIKDVEKDKVRPMNMDDFRDAMDCCKKSVTPGLLERYDKWEKELSGH